MNSSLRYVAIAAVAAVLNSACSNNEKEHEQEAKEQKSLYQHNRAPLAESSFYKLPAGSIKANGWLGKQLDLQAEGLTGHLGEIWEDVGDNSGWLGGTGESWERGPYYIRGATALAYASGDSAMLKLIDPWIEWTLNSQTKDGFFGPESNKDWWPRMLMLQTLRTHYEATGDSRVIPFMEKFFEYQSTNLKSQPITEWAVPRGGENLSSIHWLYNQTGDTSLLTLGDLLIDQTYDWTAYFEKDEPVHLRSNIDTTKYWDDSPQHTVNLSHGFKQPALVYQHTSDPRYKKAVYSGFEIMNKYHDQIHGGHAGDERMGYNRGNEGTELCSVVENMHSYEAILNVLGDPAIADRLEKIAYNALPGSIKPDWKAHPYYITPNEVVANITPHGFANEHHHDVLTYSVLSGYPCCAVNMHMGWPMLTEHLWLATPGNGLAAAIYAPNEVTAKVGNGVQVQIVEETGYPFKEEVIFKINPEKTVSFPLQLRIPAWCHAAKITINGEAGPKAAPETFVTIERAWKKGDVVKLELPMEIEISRWENNSVGVERGPLAYALAIEEDWQQRPAYHRDTISDNFPTYEIFPQSPWNYGLILEENPVASFEVHMEQEVPDQPWAPDAVPIYLTVKAKQIPTWKLNNLGHTNPIPVSPVASSQREETVKLLPFGATALRVSYMPVIETE